MTARILLFIVIIAVCLTNPAFALSQGDAEGLLQQLCEEDGRFEFVLEDLRNTRQNGEEDLTYKELMADIAQNFFHVAATSDADESKIKSLEEYFSEFQTMDSVLDNPVDAISIGKFKPLRFFKKLVYDSGQLKKKLYEEFMDSDLGTGIGLFDIDIIDGFAIAAKYNYKLDSDYRKEIHTRIDTWKPSVKIDPMTLLSNFTDIDLPVFFTISEQKEIIFVRHYKTKSEALKALPRTPLAMPLSVERARKLNPGDFVSIPVKMGLNFGAYAAITQGLFSLNTRGGILVAGEFRINLFKIDQDHIRLKITGIHSDGYNVNASLKWGFDFVSYFIKDSGNEADAEAEQIEASDASDPETESSAEPEDQDKKNELLAKIIKPVGKGLCSIIGTEFLKVERTRINARQLTVDYTFDLRDKEAGEAYEAILKKTLKFREASIAKELFERNDLEEIVFGDMEPAERIFQMDKELPAGKRRIDRPFMGSNYSNTLNGGIKFGIKLFNIGKSSSSVMNKVKVIDENDIPTNYLYNICSSYFNYSILFGLWKEKTTRSVFTFYESDSEWKPTRLFDLVFTINHHDNRCRKGELKKFVDQLYSCLGPELSAALGLNNFTENKYTKKFSSLIKIAINSDGLDGIYRAGLAEDDYFKAFLPIMDDFEYWSTMNRYDSVNSDYFESDVQDNSIYISKKWSAAKQEAARKCNEKWGGKFYWHKMLNVIQTLLESDVKSSFDYADKIRNIYLKKGFYTEILPRLLIELVKRTTSLENIYATVSMGGKDITNFSAEYKKSRFADIYHNINEILFQIQHNNYSISE